MTDGELLDHFLSRRDDAAFESVVLRHGPMVLRLCRDVLGDTHDADDAFQATFLVLVNNASAIRDRDALGRWLYGVAYRIAVRAKVRSRRRQKQERQGAEMAAAAQEHDGLPEDHFPLVHAELNRLPTKIRDPLVLCYLEGLTQEEAARRLRCPLGTLKGRLTKGRELLRSRLSRRGVALSMILLLLRLLEEKSSAGIPDALLESTVKAGVELAGRRKTTLLAEPSVCQLVRSEVVGRRVRTVMLTCLALALLLGPSGLRLVQGHMMHRHAPRERVSVPIKTDDSGTCGAADQPSARPSAIPID